MGETSDSIVLVLTNHVVSPVCLYYYMHFSPVWWKQKILQVSVLRLFSLIPHVAASAHGEADVTHHPNWPDMYIMPQQHLGIRRGKFIQSHIIRWVCVASLPLFPGRSNECGCTVSILQLLNVKKNEKIECLCAETSMWFTKWIICYMHASISNQVLHVYLQKEVISVFTAKQESVEDSHVGLVALI